MRRKGQRKAGRGEKEGTEEGRGGTRPLVLGGKV